MPARTRVEIAALTSVRIMGLRMGRLAISGFDPAMKERFEVLDLGDLLQ
jgi:hypothetical protein